jgi:hypothetical protein
MMASVFSKRMMNAKQRKATTATNMNMCVVVHAGRASRAAAAITNPNETDRAIDQNGQRALRVDLIQFHSHDDGHANKHPSKNGEETNHIRIYRRDEPLICGTLYSGRSSRFGSGNQKTELS